MDYVMHALWKIAELFSHLFCVRKPNFLCENYYNIALKNQKCTEMSDM